jgi:hypothetical protein
VNLTTESRTSTLTVHPHDPYFFDHPLDHLPGMALVCGLLDLLRATDTGHLGRPGHRLRLSLDLSTFCEPDQPVHLAAVPDGERVAVHAHQGGRLVCAGWCEFHQGPFQAAEPLEPAARELVHRHRPENVLISAPARTVALRRPPDSHRLAPPCPEAVIEAARQFTTMISHIEYAVPDDTRLILLAVEADLPCELTWDLRLRWACTAPPRGRSLMRFDVVAGDRLRGSVGIGYYAASPAIYRRLRDAGRTV